MLLILVLFIAQTIGGQNKDWQKFVALETTRADVERLLGKPIKHFERFGIYETGFGEFTVWYSSGRCEKGKAGPQYRIRPQLMTQMYVYLPGNFPLSVYISDPDFLDKSGPGVPNNRKLYYSKDESVVYETLMETDGSEHVRSATIQPSKETKALRCKESQR